MKSEDLSKELWSLANLITGFSVAQSLAASIAFGKDLSQLELKTFTFKMTVSVIVIIIAALYCGAIHSCRTLARSVDKEKSHDLIWEKINRWRIACIILFTTIFVFGLFEHDIKFLH